MVSVIKVLNVTVHLTSMHPFAEKMGKHTQASVFFNVQEFLLSIREDAVLAPLI